jgi:hypothetical protein
VIIEFVTQVGAALVAQWLYDIISARKGGSLEMEGTRIILDKGEIQEVLIEKLKSETGVKPPSS